jgi:hypothetical protein
LIRTKVMDQDLGFAGFAYFFFSKQSKTESVHDLLSSYKRSSAFHVFGSFSLVCNDEKRVHTCAVHLDFSPDLFAHLDP